MMTNKELIEELETVIAVIEGGNPDNQTGLIKYVRVLLNTILNKLGGEDEQQDGELQF